jgi:hypothetical protein
MLSSKVVLILIVIIILLIFIYKVYKYFNKNKFTNKKVIKFFGATYCPYSNTNSPSYKVMKDFEDKYKDVEVKYYWTDTEKDIPMAMEYNIEYVPTILNSNNDSIELSLPDGINKDEKTNDELRDLLLENIYNKL